MTKKYIKTYLLVIFFLASYFTSKGNDTLFNTMLLERIKILQPKTEAVFPKGIFASYRTYSLNKDRQKADITVFFTALILSTLNSIYPELTVYQQSIVNEIKSLAIPATNKFKNQKGRNTYNFWPTDTIQIFPNSGWLNLFNKSQALPDDLDDTSLLLVALNVDKATAEEVHQLMQQHTSKGQKKANNTEFKNIEAYSTWFGKKMRVDIDVSVLCNILYFVQKFELKWTAADSASLSVIEKIVAEKKYLTPFDNISPYYRSPAIVLYHITRLMELRKIPSLEKYREHLINDALNLLQNSTNFIEKVILQTSLLRFGINPPEQKIIINYDIQELIEDESFKFFILDPTAMLPNSIKKPISVISLGKFYYYCPAFNNLLLLENLAWRKKIGLSN